MTSYRAVNSQFADWEDRINKAFGHVKSGERVCLHSDRTVTLLPGDSGSRVECDYCPAAAVHPGNDVTLLPFYYKG